MFVDSYGRNVTYLRISVTDRCDFRCVYCMSEDMTFLSRKKLLSLEEIARIGKIFADNGTRKFRLTGGEPLIRGNIEWLVKKLNEYPQVNQIAITTNGSQLSRLSPALKAAGVTRLNISLDTLDAENFNKITRTGRLHKVLDGIDAAKAAGIKNIRLNTVIMRRQNEQQIIPLIEYVRENELDIAFIEEMPLGEVSHNRVDTYISSREVREKINSVFPLKKSLFAIQEEGGPADYWMFTDDSPCQIGFISPHSCNFCATCNRVRLTVEGRLLLCLGHENSIDLRAMLRSEMSDTEIALAIREGLQHKPEKHEFKISEKPVVFRHMSHTGG